MPSRADQVRFAHNAERELAGLLDSYGVAWDYEPVTFVLDRFDDGRPRWGFTPDFYLPDFQCFVELTTLEQRLVTRKNAKVRRLRELHPEVVVRLLYRHDYRHLLAKYGLAEPEQRSA